MEGWGEGPAYDHWRNEAERNWGWFGFRDSGGFFEMKTEKSALQRLGQSFPVSELARAKVQRTQELR